MAYTKVNFVDGVTSLNAANLGKMDDELAVLDAAVGTKVPAVVNGQWLKGSGGAAVWSPLATDALSATPPGSPVDGQLWSMAPIAGVVWVFRYNAGSASAYKWESVGGPSLSTYYAPQQAVVSAATWTAALPSLTIPRAGDYLASLTATFTPPGQAQALAALTLDATNQIAVSEVAGAITVAADVGVSISGIVLPGCASGATLQHIYWGSIANVQWKWRTLAILPIRVS